MIDFWLIIFLLIALTIAAYISPSSFAFVTPFIVFSSVYTLLTSDYATDFYGNQLVFENPSPIHLDSYLIYPIAVWLSSIFPGHAFIASIYIIFLPLLGLNLVLIRKFFPKSFLGIAIFLIILSCSLDPWGAYRMSLSFYSILFLTILLVSRIRGKLFLRRSNVIILSFFVILIALGFHNSASLFVPIPVLLLIRAFNPVNVTDCPKTTNLFSELLDYNFSLNKLLSVNLIRFILTVVFMILASVSVLFLFSEYGKYLESFSTLLSIKQIVQLFYLSIVIVGLLFSSRLLLLYRTKFVYRMFIYFLLFFLLLAASGSDVLIGRLSKYIVTAFAVIYVFNPSCYNSNSMSMNFMRSSNLIDRFILFILPLLMVVKQFTPLWRNL